MISKKSRIAITTLTIVVMVVLALFAVDAVKHPLNADIYELTGMEREEISAVRIWHYGQTLEVTDPDQVARILACLEGKMTRGRNTYLIHFNGGDWSVSFVDQNGTDSVSVGIYDGGEDASIYYGYYFYRLNTDFSPVYQIWEDALS